MCIVYKEFGFRGVVQVSLRYCVLKLFFFLSVIVFSRFCFFRMLRDDFSSYMVVRLKSTFSCRQCLGFCCIMVFSCRREFLSLFRYSRYIVALLLVWGEGRTRRIGQTVSVVVFGLGLGFACFGLVLGLGVESGWKFFLIIFVTV